MRRKSILFLCSLLFLFQASLSPESGLERKTVIIRKDHFGQGTMDVVHGVRILRLHGTPFEMGYQHGSMLRDELGLFRRDSFEYLRGYASRMLGLPEWLVRPFLKPVLYFWSRRFLPEIEGAHREEMKGLAKGAGLSFNDVLLLNVIWEIGELHACSELAVGGPAARNGRLWHGYIYDLIDVEQKFVDPYKAVIFYHPEGGQSFVSVGYIGMVGVYTGMNQSGISLAWDNSRLNDSGDTAEELKRARRVPEPFVFSIRRMMEGAESLEQAVRIMSELRRPLGDIVVIAVREEGRAVALETFSTHHVVRGMDKGAVWSSNCFASAKMGKYDHGRGRLAEWSAGLVADDDPELLKKSYSRHVRYSKLVGELSGSIGLEEMVRILRDPYPAAAEGFDFRGERAICSDRANFGVVYNLTDNILWVALGATPAPLKEWVGVDFLTEETLADPAWPAVIPAAPFFWLSDRTPDQD